jgi:hypothetical protein
MIIGRQYLVDPPAGWRYGFPKLYDPDKGLEEMLREAKYPEEDIEFALKYSRFWEDRRP